MKKKSLFILILVIVVLLGILFCFRDVDFSTLRKEAWTLDQIKEHITATEEIYICETNDILNRVCTGEDLIRVERNKDIIKEFIDITLTLEEFKGNSDKMLDRYVLYFVDKDKKVIISAEFNYHYIFRLLNRRYSVDSEQQEKLRNLLNINRD